MTMSTYKTIWGKPSLVFHTHPVTLHPPDNFECLTILLTKLRRSYPTEHCDSRNIGHMKIRAISAATCWAELHLPAGRSG